jgi:hypothetical protein
LIPRATARSSIPVEDERLAFTAGSTLLHSGLAGRFH